MVVNKVNYIVFSSSAAFDSPGCIAASSVTVASSGKAFTIAFGNSSVEFPADCCGKGSLGRIGTNTR